MTEEQEQEIYNLASAQALRAISELRARLLSKYPKEAEEVVLEAFHDALYGY